MYKEKSLINQVHIILTYSILFIFVEVALISVLVSFISYIYIPAINHM